MVIRRAANVAHMADDLGELLLASFADMGEAMVVQNVLEAGGMPCRIGDLANVPRHVFGIAGALGRPVGLWVLEANAERARALLADMKSGTGGIDEEALAAEALGAAPVTAGGAGPPGPAARDPSPGASAGRLPRVVTAAIAAVVVLAVLMASRGCA
jgi:hypothetical protein